MAKNVTRINGKGSESMEIADGVVSFRTGVATHKMDADKVSVMEVVNAEDARAFVKESPQDAFAFGSTRDALLEGQMRLCGDP